ncbi:M20/M25/M40 family metallo-hydrolase [Gemmatimonadota bacterium]
MSAGCASDSQEPMITPEGILRDVEVLAADSMEGRLAGTVGERRAVDYIARRFQEVGLEPVGESYLLPVELVGMQKDVEASWLRIRGPSGELPLAEEENVTFWSTSEEPVVDLADVPLVFVGYGVEAPEHDWDDFKGEDVSGKVLLFLNNDPPVEENGTPLFRGDARTYYGRFPYKFEQAQKHGAVGAIVVHTTESASYQFSVIGGMGSRRVWRRTYMLDFLAWADSTTSERIAADMGTDLSGLFALARRRDFRPVDTGYRVTGHIETNVERVGAFNVAGMVRGSDPELADEYVVFTAHHDHIGMDPGLEGEDKIYNGAQDNALGVAAIISAAEAMAHADPRRSVMFVTVTAEEGGLRGSGAFVEDPPVPLRQIVANINVDGPQTFGVTNDVAAIGLVMNTLGTTFAQVAEERGLRARGDPRPAEGSFYRSDQLSFAKAGVPALLLLPGVDYIEPIGFDPVDYDALHYHQVSDEIRPEWDLRGTARDMEILLEVALRTANADDPPRWVPGHEFEDEWRELYGRDEAISSG